MAQVDCRGFASIYVLLLLIKYFEYMKDSSSQVYGNSTKTFSVKQIKENI
jgi:hypothetical protein